MSDTSAPDPYATAKSNLRDTIKWLATSLAAVGAAVIAGASINGLAGLEGRPLYMACGLGVVGLLSILLAVAVLLNLLTSDVFYFMELEKADNPITREINANAKDILSPQTETIEALIKFRQDAHTKGKNSKPGEADYAAGFAEWMAANGMIARITNLAQFLALRNKFRSRQWLLFGLTILSIVTLGGYALLAGGKSSASQELAQKIRFDPGSNWSAASNALAKECGSDPLNGILLSKKTFDGWTSVRLTGTGKCSGLELSVPVGLVALLAQ
ncbi:hypothetical protein ACQR16_23420 [Bradyrhizobium oligotrophicum]|uniref:hypothetical protein n=1 Tax=Bradyrhizobium oligotrophicum TaxID=44255 RepID=UPI003EBA0DC1